MHRVPQGSTLVIGLGVSGRAICRHLERLGRSFVVADTRLSPPGVEEFRAVYPEVALYCGPLSALNMDGAEEVVVSPGVDPGQPALAALRERRRANGEPLLVGEIALFVRAARAPIAAITGSNAKSTVTTLLGEMAREAGRQVAVGGNLGTPALDLLAEMPDAELYILELSSFQLETTPFLGAASAAYLNLSQDHLDRHGDMTGYRKAKLAVFRGARHAVVNAEDAATWPPDPLPYLERFTTQPPQGDEWGIVVRNGQEWLMQGDEAVMTTDALGVAGRHNQANVLAALAMGSQLGFPLEAMCRALRRFKGLPHRSETLAEIEGVIWINDSKGTNVGATLAAIAGIGSTLKGRLILLAGGVGKGADFTPLGEPMARFGREAIVFGTDAPQLDAALRDHVPVHQVADLEAAMLRARAIAEPGDCVLLSPACASLDQFSDYVARGEAFRQGVQRFAEEAGRGD